MSEKCPAFQSDVLIATYHSPSVSWSIEPFLPSMGENKNSQQIEEKRENVSSAQSFCFLQCCCVLVLWGML